MAAPTNQAAWLTAKQARPLKVDSAPMPQPQPNEVVVRVHAISINPVDWVIQAMGIIIEDFPYVLGTDVAGIISAVGSEVKDFKVGDRVLAETDGADPGVPKIDGVNRGAFQLYTPANQTLTAKIPDNVSFKEACCLPLCLCTAAAALYQTENLALPLPQAGHKADKTGQVLVIWGVGSAVGANAVQMAKASGYEVAATCSSHNFDYAKGLGADYVFDYQKDTIVTEIVHGLKGKKSAGVFAAMVGTDLLGATALRQCAEVAAQLEGRSFLATVIPPMMEMPADFPTNVEVGKNWGTMIKHNNVGPYLFHEFIPAALADGTMKCKPDAEVFGKGLESLQGAMDRWKEGVSAKKIVVELP